MSLKRLTLILILSLGILGILPSFSSLAQAGEGEDKDKGGRGTGSSGGGVAIICKNGLLNRDDGWYGKRAWLADTFYETPKELLMQRRRMTYHASPIQLIQGLLSVLADTQPEIARKATRSLRELDFYMVDAKLPLLGDDHLDESELRKMGCHKEQVAIQNRRLNAQGKRMVYVDWKMYGRQLTQMDHALLWIHEALVAALPEFTDTTPIRKLLARAAQGPVLLQRLLAQPMADYDGHGPFPREDAPAINLLSYASSRSFPAANENNTGEFNPGLISMDSGITSEAANALEYSGRPSNFDVLQNNFQRFLNYMHFYRNWVIYPIRKKTFRGDDDNHFNNELREGLSVTINYALEKRHWKLEAPAQEIESDARGVAQSYDELLMACGCAKRSQLEKITAFFEREAHARNASSAKATALEAFSRFCRHSRIFSQTPKHLFAETLTENDFMADNHAIARDRQSALQANEEMKVFLKSIRTR